MADYVRAEPLFRQSLEIRDKVLGAKHPDYATGLNNLAVLYYHMARFSRADSLFQQAIEIRKETLGEGHPDYATSLGGLAVLCSDVGEYVRAEQLNRESLEVYKAVLGENHTQYATALSIRAGIYFRTGDYEQAKALWQKALEIHKAAVGERCRDYITDLNNLAVLYHEMGDYARAEPMYRRSLEIINATRGQAHPAYATGLNNLARMHVDIGDYGRAESLYRESSEIYKATLGEKHPEYATCLHNLAFLYYSMADFARAEPVYRQTLEIRKEVLGEKHPDYANSLSNLGLLYDNMADYARAEPLYRQSLEIRKEVLGEKHPDYAGGLNNLALLYYHMDDFASAEPLYRQSLEILKPVFGEMHPNYSKAHYSLAYLYHRTGDYERAEQFYSRAAAMSRMQLENSALIQSERQQLAMGLMVRYQLDNYISLSLASEDYAGPLFGEVLAWKGATLVRQRGMRLAASDPRIADRFLQLQQVARQLGALAQTVPVQLDQQESWRERVRELTNQKERLEAELSRKSAAFRAAEQEITFAQLLSALPKDAVLVDYLEYGKESRKLIAFVVRHAENEGDRVTLFNLGPVAPISEAIITWRQTFGMSPESNRAGATLRSAIWEPLVAAIGDAKTVLVSTDGVLGRLPLGALPGREPAHYLLEDHRLAYVPVPRLIPELSANRDGEEAPGRLLLVGDVDYGLNAAGQPYPWTRLPGTADEIDSLQSLKGSGNQTATALRGQEASEERIVEELSKCSVGHFATHGLFESRLECVLPMFSPLSRGATSGDSLLTLKSGEERPQTITVTRSGLVLAGANSPLKTTADQSDGESATDGLLMADEILTMPLQNTDLIVLSACDTAQGDARGGEGLLGIQRAFQVAGVRTTVASYWKVDDLATQLLMERFHQNLAQPATTPLDALRDAQLWMLRSGKGALRDSAARAITKGDSRGAKLPPELDQFAGDRLPPFYWAAFSLSGDWR